MSKDAEVKPITRGELEGMSHKEIAKVATKRRILASLPSAEEETGDGDGDGDGQVDTENLTPRERMARGHAAHQDAGRGQRRATGEGTGSAGRLRRDQEGGGNGRDEE